MDSSSSEVDLIEQLADEFAERQRGGEEPSLEEYVNRYPDLASEIRKVFPALAMIEQVAPAASDLQESQRSTDSAGPTPPRQIGDYRILREIGRGGMGVVYEAEQQSLRRRVALKILPREIAGSGRSMERFQREARAAARMHHTNIVPVFEVGSDGDTAFYAMQLIQGQGLDLVIDDLRQLRSDRSSGIVDRQPRRENRGAERGIAASLVSGEFEHVLQDSEIEGHTSAQVRSGEEDPEPAFTETLEHAVGSTVTPVLPGQSDISTAEDNRSRYHHSVAQIGLQAAGALSYAHDRGIIHRDIKPSNLLLDAGGVVWVTDFGLAKTGDEAMTHTGDVLGTLRYMSPERFQGRCDVRADIYSLGLTLYELLVLNPAFESPDRLKLIEMVRQSEPASPRSIDPRIPRDLETIVLKSINKDPKRRYQSADELLEDLRRFIDDEPIRARRISLPERLLRWSRRNKAIAALGSGLTLVLLTFSIVGPLVAIRHIQLAQAERQARKDAEQQLGFATVRGLAAQSQAIREESPVTSVLLAIEAVEFTRQRNGTITSIAHENLLRVTPNLGGEPLAGRATGRIFTLAISPNGRWVVTAGADGVARCWDLTAPDPAASPILFQGNEGFIHCAAITPDSRWMVTGSSLGTAQIWDLTVPNAPARVLELRSGVRMGGLAISPDGHWLATGCLDSIAQLWDLTADDPSKSSIELPGHKQGIAAVAISPDSDWLVTGSYDSTARLWDLESDDVSECAYVLRGHEDAVMAVAISPDGSRVITGSDDGTARVWDLDTEDPSTSSHVLRGHQAAVRALAMTKDSRWLVTASQDKTARIWDLKTAATATSAHVLQAHAGWIHSVAISPDEHWLVTGSRDGTARRWDLTAESPAESSVVMRGHDDTVNSVATTGDNRLVTASWDGTARIWDLNSEDPGSSLVVGGHAGRVGSFATSLDGHRLVTQTTERGTLRMWDLTSNLPAPSSLELRGFDEDISSIALSADGRRLATGGFDGTTCLWDVAAPDAPLHRLPGQEGRISSVAISPDDRWLVTRSSLGTVRLWDLSHSQPTSHELPGYLANSLDYVSPICISSDSKWLVTLSGGGLPRVWDLSVMSPPATSFLLPANRASSIAISTDNRLAVGTMQIWDLKSDAKMISSRLLTPENIFRSSAISPNDRWLVTGSHNGMARLWDLTADDPASSSVALEGHTSAILAIAISANSRWAVTASEDGTARVWELTAKDPASSSIVLRGHESTVNAAVFTPDSRWILTGSGADETVRLWDLDVDRLIDRARRLAGRELTSEERKQYLLLAPNQQ